MIQVCEALPDTNVGCILRDSEAFCKEDELTQTRLKLYFLKKRNDQLYLWDLAYYNYMYFKQLREYGYCIEKAMELGYFDMAKFVAKIKDCVADVKAAQTRILGGERVYFVDKCFTKPQNMDGLHCNKRLVEKTLNIGFRCKVCSAEFDSDCPKIIFYKIEDLIKNSK